MTTVYKLKTMKQESKVIKLQNIKKKIKLEDNNYLKTSNTKCQMTIHLHL